MYDAKIKGLGKYCNTIFMVYFALYVFPCGGREEGLNTELGQIV
jgi:hypothetical protein